MREVEYEVNDCASDVCVVFICRSKGGHSIRSSGLLLKLVHFQISHVKNKHQLVAVEIRKRERNQCEWV